LLIDSVLPEIYSVFIKIKSCGVDYWVHFCDSNQIG
jgi:hypothetical protein